MTVWFVSDTHFYHKNVIDFCDRPVPKMEDRQERVKVMNSLLIERWNERIKVNDEVYHLGDFAFCGKTARKEIIQKLNGRKYLVRGNHDPDKEEWWKEAGFEWVRDYHKLMIHDKYEDEESGEFKQYHQVVILCHFPILSWDGMSYGTWMLHGHCHGSLPPTKMMRLDVGVDTNDLYPYSYDEVKNIMTKRSVIPVDHHGL